MVLKQSVTSQAIRFISVIVLVRLDTTTLCNAKHLSKSILSHLIDSHMKSKQQQKNIYSIINAIG